MSKSKTSHPILESVRPLTSPVKSEIVEEAKSCSDAIPSLIKQFRLVKLSLQSEYGPALLVVNKCVVYMYVALL